MEGEEKWGETRHVEFWIMLMVWDYINETFFVVFLLADDLFKVHKLKPNLKWRQAFDNYLKTMPPYYLLVCSFSPFILPGIMADVTRGVCIIPLPSKSCLCDYDDILGSKHFALLRYVDQIKHFQEISKFLAILSNSNYIKILNVFSVREILNKL